MKLWTAHEKSHAVPVLVREGFSAGALVFGPFWLAWHRAWIPAGVAFCLSFLIPALTDPPASVVLGLAMHLLLGLSGRDLIRWSLRERGFTLTDIVAARNEEEAIAKLLTERPDLVTRTMATELAP